MALSEEEKKERKAKSIKKWREKNKDHCRAYDRAYAEMNSEKIKERHKKWLIANAGRVKETGKAYRVAHAERIKDQHKLVSRTWYLKNRERVIATSRQWEKDNPEKRRMSREKCIENKRETDREYRRNNPTKMRVHSQNRKARKRASGGRLSVGIVMKLLVLQKGKCASCKKLLVKTGHHIDHVISLARGGEHSDSNIQLLCPKCNMSKGAKHPVDFMRSRGFLL